MSAAIALRQRLASAQVLFLLLSCGWGLAFVVLHATWFERRAARLTALPLTREAQDIQEMSVLQGLAADGYCWLRHARDMEESGRWRIQFTEMDNAPEGREVAWSSGFAWWLIGLRASHQALTSSSDERSWSWAATWANPLLLCVALLALPALLARRFGPLAAGLSVFAMLGSRQFYEGFLPGYPDHHGLISLAAVGSLLGVLMAAGGWFRRDGAREPWWPTSAGQVRFWMRFSALSGALGMWISAVSQAVLLLGIGIGAIVAVWSLGRTSASAGSDDAGFDAEAWATWGRWGAGLSLGFYLLERFPGEMGMQLPANHPLHALAWWGGGEVLAALSRCILERRMPDNGERRRLILGAACALVLPGAIVLGPSSWWSLGDPFLAAVHREITEFKPLLVRMSERLDLLQWAGALPLVLVPALALLFRSRTPLPARAMLVLAVLPALTFIAASFHQTRWAQNSAGPLVLVLVATLSVATGRAERWLLPRWSWVLLVSLALVPAPIQELRAAWRKATEERLDLTRTEARDLLLRDIAAAVRSTPRGASPIVLSSPSATLRLCYFGRMRGLGTLYWENLEGLKAAAEIYSAPSDEEARVRIQQRGVTHLVFVEVPGALPSYIDRYHELSQYLEPDPASRSSQLESTFAFRSFIGDGLPDWLRPVPYDHPLLQWLDARVKILEVVEERVGEEGGAATPATQSPGPDPSRR